MIGKTTGQPRAVTLRDARTDNLVPSVTTVLKLLHKEALVNWKIEQAVLAVLTSPKKEDETIDAFVERIIHVEEVPMQEARLAADKGTEIHAAIEGYFTGQDLDPNIVPWVVPAAKAVAAYGELVATEKIIVGDGFAGKTDLILLSPDCWWLWDYKSTKKLPDPKKGGAWLEHRLQLAAYAQGWQEEMARKDPTLLRPIRTANLYVSSVNPGEFVICENEDWEPTYLEGFAPLVTHWQWAAKYRPQMPNRGQVRSAREVANEVLSRPVKPEAMGEPPLSEPAIAAPATQPAPAQPSISKEGKRVVWSPGIATPPSP